MRFIFVIRPEPGLSATLKAGYEMSLHVIGYPLFLVDAVEWEPPDPADYDALLVGSANAFRRGGDKLRKYRQLPAHVVGEATANAAREAGFATATVGSGGLQAVVDDLQGPLRLLRIAGEEHVPLQQRPAISITTVSVYRIVPRAMDYTLAFAHPEDSVVLLHSAAAARHFASEIDRLGADRAGFRLACLGPRIAAAAGTGWAACESAPQPRDSALLALARDLG